MREMRGLMLGTRFIELTRGSFNPRSRVIALLNEDVPSTGKPSFFTFQRGDARFALEQRVRFHRAAAAEDDARGGNKLAIQCRHRQRWFVFLSGKRVA